MKRETLLVYLYSNEDKEGNIVPIEYDLSPSEVDAFEEACEMATILVPFGRTKHNAQDIVRTHYKTSPPEGKVRKIRTLDIHSY